MGDLHIHSTLSPCGSLEMSPTAIVNRAYELGLNLIAITDHNAIENGYYASKIAKRFDINIIYGLEAQTEEEIHTLVFFDTYEQAHEFYKVIYPKLPDISNVPEHFGDQVVVDENDEIIRAEKKLLLNSLTMSIDELYSLVKDYGGLCMPAHVDRESYSIIAQLGFIPEHLDFKAVEISYMATEEEILERFPFLKKYTLVSFSDAHYLKDIGRVYTEFYLSSPSIKEIKKALKKEEGRYSRIVRKQGGYK
ncbi:MAG TPA: PHP domain-containing protein [candidate division WOR-3 bacterium]|uniref:PHP domain-containing protein n=1 Tax=candidate division WOR-3 bacterium TaxID=2052148 RepID=A0A7V5LUK0_UNCW3|nr:PHP domain-containing protein [candidate division WOR-3 bacterium]